MRFRALLGHLSVLTPVRDAAKHSFVDEGEIERLQRLGEGWLDVHPERELILRRALKHRRDLLRLASARFGQLKKPATESTASL